MGLCLLSWAPRLPQEGSPVLKCCLDMWPRVGGALAGGHFGSSPPFRVHGMFVISGVKVSGDFMAVLTPGLCHSASCV